ncbi:hypothetical protein TUMEXPCC7403_14920 [Tumidithrix helvetica PCC 7403]|uniref:hypothetical protein n=1 Tax=Tumidithrix helvetica TaxID=3457545 RepID=UPI003C87938E
MTNQNSDRPNEKLVDSSVANHRYSKSLPVMSNPNSKNKVCLSEEQRQRLRDISRNGTAPVKKVLHARVLLMSDQEHPEERWTDTQISEALGLHTKPFIAD